MNLSSAATVLRNIVAESGGVGGAGDSHAALYDLSYPKAMSLMSTTMLADEQLLKPVAGPSPPNPLLPPQFEFFGPLESPSPLLNEWYAVAMEASVATIRDSASGTSVSDNTINYNTTHVGGGEVSVSYRDGVVRHRGRFLSFCHAFLGPANELHLFLLVSTEESYYFREQRKARDTVIGIGVAFAVVIVVLVGAMIAFIGVAIWRLTGNMDLAAKLRNEEVAPLRSILTEIDALCTNFALMNEKLLAARAFMPASMLVRSSDDEGTGADIDGGLNGEEDDDDDTFYDDEGDFGDSRSVTYSGHHSATGKALGGLQQQSRKRGGGGRSRAQSNASHSAHSNYSNSSSLHPIRLDGTTTRIVGVTKSRQQKQMGGNTDDSSMSTAADQRTTATAYSTAAAKGGGAPQLSGAAAALAAASAAAALLKTRRVGVLCLNVRGFTTATVPSFGPTALTSLCSRLVETVNAVAGAERGVVDSFHGDHFVLTFNAVRVAGAPGRRAVVASFALREALAQLGASMAKTTGRCQEDSSAAAQQQQQRKGLPVVNNNNSKDPSGVVRVPASAMGAAVISSPPPLPLTALSMGAACGNATVGPLGSALSKRLSIIGPCYSRALRLQRACDLMERAADPLFYTQQQCSTEPQQQQQHSSSAPLVNSTADPDAKGTLFAPTPQQAVGAPQVHVPPPRRHANLYGCLVDTFCYEEAVGSTADMLLIGAFASYKGEADAASRAMRRYTGAGAAMPLAATAPSSSDVEAKAAAPDVEAAAARLPDAPLQYGPQSVFAAVRPRNFAGRNLANIANTTTMKTAKKTAAGAGGANEAANDFLENILGHGAKANALGGVAGGANANRGGGGGGADEWMYELREAAQQDPFALASKASALLMAMGATSSSAVAADNDHPIAVGSGNASNGASNNATSAAVASASLLVLALLDRRMAGLVLPATTSTTKEGGGEAIRAFSPPALSPYVSDSDAKPSSATAATAAISSADVEVSALLFVRSALAAALRGFLLPNPSSTSISALSPLKPPSLLWFRKRLCADGARYIDGAETDADDDDVDDGADEVRTSAAFAPRYDTLAATTELATWVRLAVVATDALGGNGGGSALHASPEDGLEGLRCQMLVP